jgi:hypothetical protein
MCFEAWNEVKKYQRAKIEDIQAISRGRKTGLSDFGYRSIWFSQNI